MYNELMSTDTLTTFVGLVAGTSLIVQFTKTIIKRRFGEAFVRIYTFLIAFVLIIIFGDHQFGVQGILIKIINAIMVTMSAMGGYEALSDPRAQKMKIKH